MKISTTKEKIVRAVQLAERITGKKESLPVLSCVLFDVSAHDTVVRATNLEAGIEVAVPAEIEIPGTIAVPAGILSQTLRSLGGDKVVLRTEEGNLIVESRGSKTLIKAIPPDEFPVLPDIAGGTTISLPRERVIKGIQAVAYAASSSMIRPELGSVFLSVSPEGFVCVATDSFRLAEKAITGVRTDGRDDLLIPLKHAIELMHVLEYTDAHHVDVRADDSQMTVVSGGARFISRVVDATFPNYKEIIPKNFATEATALKGDVAEMLRKARIFSGNEQNVGLHVYPKQKIFTATAHSADVGEMSDTIDAALSGDDIDINFHIGYLSDCLSAIDADSVTFGFAGAGRPLVIRGVSDQSFTYVVMPLNR